MIYVSDNKTQYVLLSENGSFSRTYSDFSHKLLTFGRYLLNLLAMVQFVPVKTFSRNKVRNLMDLVRLETFLWNEIL